MKRIPWLALTILMVVGLAGFGLASRAPERGRAPGSRSGALGSDESGDADLEEGAASLRVPTVHVRTRVLSPPSAPPNGWAGEVQVANEDTWEPSVAADPSAPFVYVMYDRYGVTCKRCPNPQMELRISSDGGATWGAEQPICTCLGVNGQYDPVLQTSSSGSVFATWMNYNKIMFSRSNNHGLTWSTPLQVSGNSWGDKPWIGVSASGNDVYIAYESRSVLQMASSHNGGASFSAAQSLNSDTSVYRYPNGFEVLPNGTAILSASKYSGGSSKTAGPIAIEVWRSTNGGSSWISSVVDASLFTGVDFNTSSTTTIGSDAAGTLVLEYSGATTLGGNGRIFVRRSTDGGVTWSARSELGSPTANASFPAIAGGAAGTFRLTYMDNRAGPWNLWYRASSDGGLTWSTDARISDATGGASYKSATGFTYPYGDYDAIDITSTGKSVTVSGQGVNFSTGPGSIWFNRQT